MGFTAITQYRLIYCPFSQKISKLTRCLFTVLLQYTSCILEPRAAANPQWPPVLHCTPWVSRSNFYFAMSQKMCTFAVDL